MTKLLGLNMHPLWLGDGRAEDFLLPHERAWTERPGIHAESLFPWLAGDALPLDSPKVGICWDLGHDVCNGSAPVPLGFITSVRHVHLHDISPVASISFSINTSVPSPCSQ